MSLFTAQELADFVQEDVDAATGARVEQVVWGWLMGPLGLTNRPEPPTEDVYAAALELGAIAFFNPGGLASYQLGQERWQYGTERRAAILAEVAGAAGQVSGLTPRGSFPDPCPWPDTGRRWR